MNFKDKLKNSIVYLDGAMGTMLQRAGLALGELPEEWNLSHPDKVSEIHRAYIEAGSDVIYANTFGANCLKFGERTESVIAAGIACAKNSIKGKKVFVALDVGPTGAMLKPIGNMDFEQAVDIFKRTISAGATAGADLIAIETMNDCYELKAAMVAAKECCSLPVIVSAVFGKDAKTMSGSSPEAFVALAEGLGADALGLNCSLAPSDMKPVVDRLLAAASVPVLVKPNAGLPEEVDGKTVYSLSSKQFAKDMAELVDRGVRLVGGCCGTSPEYLKELKLACDTMPVKPVENKELTVISSYTHALYFGDRPLLIGERINPTGKKRLKEALRARDIGYVLNEAISQADRGADALDVNVGLPEIDETQLLPECIYEIQAVTDLPLQIDCSHPAAIERAMRIYNGKPLINSVNGKPEVMAEIFPLIKKYGGCVICLTLDQNGIPATALGRVEIAKKIIAEAEKYGISRNQLIFDTLAMAISADQTAANVSLEALKIIREELGCHTSLGVSNISFGLPQRDFITSTYLVMALCAGLSAAIYNPYSAELEKAYNGYLALSGKDANCTRYIDYASSVNVGEITKTAVAAEKSQPHDLAYCIVKGLKKEAADCTVQLLSSSAPLDVINQQIIPALNEVGKGFENKTVYLPQLLMSAEAASAAFDVIKGRLGNAQSAKKTAIVMATVKGDIHDIGKNIVCTLLRNYGFTVHDLGRDVPPEDVVKKVKETGAELVGLSALMTTTVVSMKQTVAMLKQTCKGVKVCVGGAVLNEEYAKMIGADRYCKDAMETVRFAEQIEKN